MFKKLFNWLKSLFKKQPKIDVKDIRYGDLPTQREVEEKVAKAKKIQKSRYTHKSTKEKARLKRHTSTKEDIEKYDDEIIREYVSKLYIRRVPQESLTNDVKKRLGCYVSPYDIKKHCVAQIRHNYSNYEKLCNESRYDLTKEDAKIIHDILKYETMNLIDRFYDLSVITSEIIKAENLDTEVRKYFKEGYNGSRGSC